MTTNASLQPGWYWSHRAFASNDTLVPADYPLACNHGPFTGVLEAYNAAEPNQEGQCVVLLHVGEMSGLLRVFKPKSDAVFQPAAEPSIAFVRTGDVARASPPGATITIELDRPDQAHVLLSLEGLSPISFTVRNSLEHAAATEACSLASSIYWSRQRAVNSGPSTWSIEVAAPGGAVVHSGAR